MKKYFLIFFISFSVNSQLLSPIQSFSPDQYNAANQNWDITQSDENDIFFANNDGLLKYNGSRWTTYSSPNGSIVRSIKAVKNRVYAGLYEDFGYWEKDISGNHIYVSLVNENELTVDNDEEFWNILYYDDWLIFQSYKRLIMYNEVSREIKTFEPSKNIFNSFIVEKRIYYTLSSGLYTIENGNEKLISNDTRLKNRNQYPHILNIFKKDNSILIVTDKLEFLELLPNGNLIDLYSLSTNPLFSGISVFKTIRLKDGGFAIGTVGRGLMLIDKNGNLIKIIDKSQGIINNTILSLYEDSKNNLWLGLDNGISLINSESAFKIYNDSDGILGTVYASKFYKGILYVGTNQGLFYKKPLDTKFKLVPNTSGQVWSLTIINDSLFCGHNNGSFVIERGFASKIENTTGSWTFRKVSESSELILEGGYSGINVLTKKDDKWVVRNKIKGFDISSRLFEVSKNGKIIVSHGYKGIYKLSLSPDFYNLKNVIMDSTVTIGGNASLAKFGNEIYYNFSGGFYKYDELKDVFNRDIFLSNLSDKELINGIIINDNNNKLWLFSENYMHYVYKDLMSNENKIKSIIFPEKLRKTVFENISRIKNEEYIIGTNNGYILFDLEKYFLNSPSIQLERVEVSNRNELPFPVTINEGLKLDYRTNNINFYFNSSNFQKFETVEYQHLLEGYMEQWSSFNEDSNITFSNLRFGDYNFKVRSKIGNTISDDIKSFEFSIERPWYGSNFMIANYALLLGVLFFIFNNYYVNFYRKKEEKMIRINQSQLELKEIEKKQALMSIENEKLSQDIDGKNRELAISTMSMIKKNQFLSKIKSDLKEAESSSKISSVIKVIDRHLNNQDDWKFFEEAFNNADKDFLKKVKNYHPSLTNNDLRLCAYLRLNLSSKDIAPLLNISLSSVEIKRYRLRKKMNLSRNEGLTDHLLSL
ncbi:MAG: LuxR family transcriptional regulator [Flavobacteriaceae bacterium]|nr:LuxR family transcriptional regulator [Flavobacteriaceae bacterium]